MNKLYFILLLIAFVASEDIAVTADDAELEAPATACHNSYWDLRPLRRDG